MQMELLGHVANARGTAAAAYVEYEALGVEGVVGQEGKLFLLHLAAAPALDASDFQVEVDAEGAAGEVAHAPAFPVVNALRLATTGSASSFFPWRTRVTTRA